MFPFIPLSEYSEEDLRRLISEKVAEGDRIEFKATLPNKDGTDDPWICGENRISDRARDKILSELIALANSHGGYLFLGIEESSDKPPKAARISALPRCAELAERISQMADALIDPRLPQFTIKPIQTDLDGKGVLVLHTLRSTLAPHRFTPNNECYFRRNDRCERMTMHEIQNLSLRSHRQVWEGLWTAKFFVPGYEKNGGVIVLDEGRIFGGDAQFYYEGRYDVQDDVLMGEIRVAHYHGDDSTAFGDRKKRFTVMVRANRFEDRISGTLSRHDAPNIHPRIEMVRQANLP